MNAVLSQPVSGKVVVTGASGFIGSRLRDALLAGGAEVVSLVRASSPASKQGRSAAVDYRDVRSLRALFEREKPDYVFHVAGATKGVSYQDFHDGNVMPTVNLSKALLEAHPAVKRFVHVSSLAAYGPSQGSVPKRETDPREPLEHYGRSKLEAERAVESLESRLPWTIIRPSVVYGPGEVDLFNLFKTAHLGVNLFYGNREKRASAIFADDLVDAIVNAARAERTIGRGYFLCDGVPYTWGEIQRHIGRAVGKTAFNLSLPSFVVPLAGRAGELLTKLDQKPRLLNRQKAIMDAQQAWLCTHEAAAQDFGYKPRVFVPEGTRRAYEWYKANGWL